MDTKSHADKNGSLLAQIFTDLQTPRLILRKMRLEDAPALFEVFSDKEVTRYLSFSAMKNPSQAQDLIQANLDWLKQGKAIRWGITLRDKDKVIGTCGFHNISTEHRRAEIGYDLGKPYWRQGMMTEALTTMLSWGFKHLFLNRIEAVIQPKNTASQKFLKSLGFEEEGLLRDYQFYSGRFFTVKMYAILRRDFRKQPGNQDIDDWF